MPFSKIFRFACCVLAGLSAPALAQDDGAAVAEIRAALARDGQVRVIVEMNLPARQSARGLERPSATAEDSVAVRVERNRAAVSTAAGEMRNELAAAAVTMEQEFENLPLFTTTINEARLERLLRIPGVKQVYLDKPVARRSAQPEKPRRSAQAEFPLPGVVLEKVPLKSTAGNAVDEATAEAAARAQAAQDADDPAKALLSSTVTYINADDAWSRGFTGRNTSVAILDDGIDRNHDMFVGKIVAEACYSTRVRSDDVALCPNNTTSSTAVGAASNCGAASNLCAHGSHVAGIAAGNDTIGSVTLRGVAYEANLIPIQVFTLVNNQSDCDNAAPCLLAYSSAILNGLNYAIGQASARNLAAVNLSLGGEPVTGACDTDVRKTAIDTLRGLGVLTTIAAGNDAKVGQITPPACISTAIAVSSTIITVPDSGVNQAANVDVLAPGVLVRSANLNNSYSTRSGTSMAAPHAAGAVALLKSSRPTATASEIETALKTGGIAASLSTWTWTTPRMDINRSLDILGAGGGVVGVAMPGVFGSKNPTATSYLRFFNADFIAGTVTVRIYDDLTGAQVATWSRQVAGLASPQVAMSVIEAEASPPITGQASASQFYTLFVDAPFVGYAQHVLYSPQTNLLSNVSGCDNGLADSGGHINNTHTTLIGGYTSFLLVHNTGATDAKPSFDVRDARNGASMGDFTTSGNIKAHSSALIRISDALQTLGRTPESGQFHLNMIMSQTGFTGFAQHLVQNDAQGILTNITAKCDI